MCKYLQELGRFLLCSDKRESWGGIIYHFQMVHFTIFAAKTIPELTTVKTPAPINGK